MIIVNGYIYNGFMRYINNYFNQFAQSLYALYSNSIKF